METCSFQKEQLALKNEIIQALKDEIARLKGEKRKPDIKPSNLEKGSGNNNGSSNNGKKPKKRSWQDVDYVLSYFNDTDHRAKKDYYSYVESGLEQGRRSELTGGGLIRSLGGWTEVRKYGLKVQDHIKSDERILGESDFVADVLSQANEKFDRKYELKRLGYDLGGIAARVAEIYDIEVDDIFLKGKQQKRVKARSLFCFWAVRELGISLTELAGRLGISVPGVGYSVERGEIIARNNDYQLIE